MNTNSIARIAGLALAASVTTGLAATPAAAQKTPMEKCYGVAKAGETVPQVPAPAAPAPLPATTKAMPGSL